MNTCFKRVKRFLSLITVEPIAFFHSMAFSLHSVVSQTGMYNVYCHQLFGDVTASNQTVDCDHLADDPFAENEVQQFATHWNMITALARLLPSLITYIVLGAWGDKHGRKINILLGIATGIVGVFPQIYIFQYQDTSLWIYVLVQLVIGIFGSGGLIMISSFAYLADSVENKENLTIRMVIYGLVSTTSSIIGSSLASTVMPLLSMTYILVLGQILMFLSFLYALIRLQQISPSLMRNQSHTVNGMNDDTHTSIITDGTLVPIVVDRVEAADDVPLLGSNSEKGVLCKSDGANLLVDGLDLVNSVWRTYTKVRKGKGRAYLLLLTGVYGLYLIGEMGKGSITTLYLFRSPFSWTGENLGYYKSLGSILTFLGNLCGAVILKKIFKCRETTIILIALVSAMADLITLGISSTAWMLYMALSLGCLGSLFLPTVKSFTSQIVDEDEVGKSFIAYGFTADLAIILNVIAANSIYSATVSFYPGFIFLLCAGFILIGFIVILWIHVDILVAKKSLAVLTEEPQDFI